MHFENSEENKLIYMTLFQRWQSTVEAYVYEKLGEMLPGFNMEDYAEKIEERKEEIDESLLDLLDSFTDF